MQLNSLLRLFSDCGCDKVYIKSLAANDNSKNQIYFAGNVEALNIFPVKEFVPREDGERKRATFIANLDFLWVDQEGKTSPAPQAKFIVYPDYPEIRFSGFLQGCKQAPNTLMNSREVGRQLFLGVSDDRRIFGYVSSANSDLTSEVLNFKFEETAGVFNVISLDGKNVISDSKQKLLSELKRIHQLGWIDSKRLNKHGKVIDCDAPQCGGYTLEAELGIIPNARTEPDYLGWELKQFAVTNFERINSKKITLITPEPDEGYYGQNGMNEFVYKYGYPAANIANRKNFGGIFRNGIVAQKTGLKLEVYGFDIQSKTITKTDGGILLLDKNDNIAAKWSFASFLTHWNLKHAKTSYIPSKKSMENGRKYSYSNNILLGEHTNFNLFLEQLCNGNIYYDPALKVENIDLNPKGKPRNQFRIKSGCLNLIYKQFTTVDLNTI